MTKIEWTRSAISDVKSLRDYIARDSEAYADRFVQKIIEVVDKAGAFPHMGRRVDEANEEGVREILFAFLEQIVKDGFYRGCFIIAADDPGFWQGSQTSEIYKHFRGQRPIHGRIVKPTGKKDEQVDVQGSYTVTWKHLGRISYSIVAVGMEDTKSV